MSMLVNPFWFGSSGGGSGGVPLTISDLALWLKADAGVFSDAGSTPAVDGDLVTQWNDQSGNNNHAGASVKPTYETNSLNGLPSIRFPGSKHFGLTSSVVTTEITVFCVSRRFVTSSFIGLFSAPTNGLAYAFNSSGNLILNKVNVSTLHTSSLVDRRSMWLQSNFTKSASSNLIAQRVNGASAGSTTTTTTDPLTIIGENSLNGYISEIIIYSRELSGTEITTIEDYLEAKYGIAARTQLLWLAGDAITGLSDGDSLTKWVDQSGNGNHFTVPSGKNAPTYKTNLQNSLPGVRFSTDTNMGLSSLLRLVATPYSIYIVYDYRSATSANRRALQGTTNWLIGPYQNTHKCFSGGFSTGLAVTQNQFVIQSVIGSGSSNTNNVNKVGYTSGGSATPDLIGLSAIGAFAEPLDGDVLEVQIFSVAHDSTAQDAVIDALASKYSISV